MKGISNIKDETHNKRFVQIDLESLEQIGNNWEEMYDIIIAELRKEEETKDWEEIKKELIKEGKLDV